METAKLHVHICQERRGYNVTFSTQEQAIAFLAPKSATHAYWELDGGSIPMDSAWDKLREFVYPTCQHGMSADLCYGDNHYMSAEQECSMGLLRRS